VPPGFSLPAFSASSIIFTAMRSLIELPGLVVSILRVDVGGNDALGNAVQANQWRVADGFEDVVVDWSGHREGSRVEQSYTPRTDRAVGVRRADHRRTRGRCRRRRDIGRVSTATAG
jgi:hypothetical protein